MTKENKEMPITEFKTEDIQDVRIIIKAKGKHFSLVPNRKVLTEKECAQMRIAMASLLFNSHYVVSTPLEDLKTK